MNNFFVTWANTIVKKFHKGLSPSLKDKLDVTPEKPQFEIQAFDVPQIRNIFGKFKTSNGFGPDGNANHFLNIGFSVIAEALNSFFISFYNI